MATREFPALGFDPAPGDPAAVDSAARSVDGAGRVFGDASSNVNRLNSSGWSGEAADAFRGQLADLPRDLDLAARTHQTTARTLTEYGQGLATRQRRATELETRAAELKRQQQAAIAEVNRLAGRTAPEGSAELANLRTAYNSARSQAEGFGGDLDEVIRQARALHGDHESAAQTAARTIRDQADAPYEEPGWLSRAWDSVKGWIADHADVLQTISTVLKGVSAVLGVLSLVPGLQFLAPFALAAGGIALAIDVAVKLATGKGSWASIGIDAALTFMPWGRVGGLVRRIPGAARGLDAAGDLVARGASRFDDMVAGGRRALGLTDEARDTAIALERRICAADPVDVVSGEMVLAQTDVDLPGVLPLTLRRTYVSSYRSGFSLGPTWASTLDARVEAAGTGVLFADEDGTVLLYPSPAGGPVLPVEGPRLPLATSGDGWTVTRPDGRTLHFGADGLLAAVTDPIGSRLSVTRDAAGLPVSLEHSGGYRIAVESEAGRVVALLLHDGERRRELVRYGYDEGGRLAAVVNSSGVPLRFRSDDEGRIVRWDDRNGTWYGYEYDASGRCVRTTGADDALSATFEHGDGVTVVTNSLGHATTYEHDAHHQVVRETDPLGAVTLSEWDRYDRLLSRTDPLGRTTRWEYDDSGSVTRISRPDGTSSTASYGAFGKPVRVVDPDGATWRYTHDPRGLVTAVTDPVGATTRYGYDAAGHLATVTDALRRTRRVTSDAAGLPVTVTDPVGAATHYTRDAYGRVVEVRDPIDAVTRFSWTPEGKLAALTLPDGATERWAYDGEGNEVSHTDALGQVTRTEITGFDLVAARTAPDGARTSFTWDSELRLTSVTDPTGLVWTYTYDPAGRLTTETDYDGRTTTYTHDPAGQTTSVAVTGAGVVQLRYDTAGRLVERRTEAGVSTYRYDAVDRLIRATNPDADLVVRRDPLGRVLSEAIDGEEVTSRFDLLGRRVWRRTPSGAETSWDFGADDRPLALHAGDQLLTFDYDPAGRETARRIGPDTLLTQRWDRAGRMTTQTLTAGPTRLQHRTFGYRPDSVLTEVDDIVAGTRRYDLDARGRATAVRTAAAVAETYAYGPNGAPTGPERAYAGTRLSRAGRFRYEYDAAGRVALRQQSMPSSGPRNWRYEWSDEHRLTAVTTPDGTRWRYGYDALGRRVRKMRLAPDGSVAERVDFAWDGATLAEQRSAAGRLTWDWSEDGLRALTQRERRPSQGEMDERFYAIVTDLVGTPVELVTPDGDLARSSRATLWGSTTSTGPADTPLRFPGQYHDDETGLHYNVHRYYDPASARYACPDPLGIEGGPDPYAYVPNPTGWIDPLGLTPCNQTFGNRTEAFNAARDRAGIPRSQQPTRQWTVGDDVTRRGQANYHYDPNPGAHGRYYQYETPQGTRVVANHTADPNAPSPHFHAGQPKPDGRNVDMQGQRYGQVDGKHHYYYP